MSEPGNPGNKKPRRRDHPEMMGDETEEQSLGQSGRKGARISEEEVAEAFEEDDLVEAEERHEFWAGFACGAVAAVAAILVIDRVRLRYD